MSNPIAIKLQSLSTRTTFRHHELAKFLCKRPESLSRWIQGHSYPSPESDKDLRKLEFIVDKVASLYDPITTRQWFFIPQPQHGGFTPAGLLRIGRIDAVMRMAREFHEAESPPPPARSLHPELVDRLSALAPNTPLTWYCG